MCGIAGYLASYPRGVARAMGSLIAHRGPDDEGLFYDAEDLLALAHRRLSIIDLSPAGHQPMTDAGGRYTITYNGEVYNYRELRGDVERRGVVLRGHSDTEVILALFALDGVSSFARLNGIFAFATDVGGALGLVGVEPGVPARLDLVAVLDDDRPQQALAVADGGLQRRRVAGAGRPRDLPQADPVDAVDGEEVLGRADEPVGGGSPRVGAGATLGAVVGMRSFGQLMHAH